MNYIRERKKADSNTPDLYAMKQSAAAGGGEGPGGLVCLPSNLTCVQRFTGRRKGRGNQWRDSTTNNWNFQAGNSTESRNAGPASVFTLGQRHWGTTGVR
jgi:hypothetical protein